MQALFLEPVDRFHGLEQLGHVASLLGSAHQGLHVFGKVVAALATARPDELEASAEAFSRSELRSQSLVQVVEGDGSPTDSLITNGGAQRGLNV